MDSELKQELLHSLAISICDTSEIGDAIQGVGGHATAMMVSTDLNVALQAPRLAPTVLYVPIVFSPICRPVADLNRQHVVIMVQQTDSATECRTSDKQSKAVEAACMEAYPSGLLLDGVQYRNNQILCGPLW